MSRPDIPAQVRAPTGDKNHSILPIASCIALVLDGVICLAAAIDGGKRPNRHFIEGGVITWINGAQLLLACAVAFGIFRVVAARGRAGNGYIWPLVAMGSIYLAADETMQIHESIGHYAQDRGFPHPPMLNGYGDAILLVYGLLAVGVGWRFRAELFRHRPSTRALMLAVAFLFISEMVDFFGVHQGRERFWWSVTEESFKLMGFGLVLGALIDRLRAEIANIGEPGRGP